MALGIVLSLYITFSVVTGMCVFPYFLRKNSWLYKMSADPYSKTVVEFTENTIRFEEQNVPSKHVHRSKVVSCLSEIGFRKFITEENNGTSRIYRCLTINERSPSLVQFSYSAYSLNYTDTLCSGALFLDSWLLVSYTGVEHEYISCPFQSGYNMKITDSYGYEHGCNYMDLPMRFEIDCLGGEGIIMDFRKEDCVDFLPLEKRQVLICVSHWVEEKYHFVVARKVNTFELLTFRFPRKYQDNYIKVELFTDFTAPIDSPGFASRYFILSLEKIIRISVCEDEYPECSNSECSEYYRHQCQKSCNQCDQNIPLTICSFPLRFRGEWYGYNSEFLHNVTIGESEIHIQSLGRFTCIVNEQTRSNSLYSVLSTFQNGCRPRLTCVDIQKISTGIIGYSISQSLAWPFSFSSNCQDVQFREDSPPIYDHYRTNRYILKPLLPFSFEDIKPIDCELASSFKFHAKIYSKGSCQGRLYQSCKNSSVLHMEYENCRSQPSGLTFICVAHIKGSRQNVLLLEDFNNRHKAVCLVYSKIHGSKLIMLPSEKCDSNSWLYVENFKRTPIMLIKTEREQKNCDEMPFITTTATTQTTTTVQKASYTIESTVSNILTEPMTDEIFIHERISGENNVVIITFRLWIICFFNIILIIEYS